MSLLLFLLRHGETDWNRDGRMQGEADIPLNDTGRGQAAENGARLKQAMAERGFSPDQFDYVASPLSRAQETMQIVRAALNLPRTGYDLKPQLREIAMGEWSGLTYTEINDLDPTFLADGQIRRWTDGPKGGESFGALAERAVPWFRALQRPTVCVCHGGTIRTLIGAHMKLGPRETIEFHVPQHRFFLLTDTGKERI